MPFDKNKVAEYWNFASAEKWKVAEDLKTLRHFPESLFFCHLALECRLKAVVALKTNTHPPYIHDLVELARVGGLAFSSKQLEDLKEISTFNISGRYPEYRQALRGKATRDYFDTYWNASSEIISWLSSNK